MKILHVKNLSQLGLDFPRSDYSVGFCPYTSKLPEAARIHFARQIYEAKKTEEFNLFLLQINKDVSINIESYRDVIHQQWLDKVEEFIPHQENLHWYAMWLDDATKMAIEFKNVVGSNNTIHIYLEGNPKPYLSTKKFHVDRGAGYRWLYTYTGEPTRYVDDSDVLAISKNYKARIKSGAIIRRTPQNNVIAFQSKPTGLVHAATKKNGWRFWMTLSTAAGFIEPT